MTNLGSTQTHTRQARNAVMRSVLLFLCALAAMTLQAQEQKQDTTTVKNEKKEKKLYLWGYLSDSFTRTYIPDVKVVVLRPDSSLVDSAQISNGYGSFKSSEYYLQVPAKPAKYIIKATHPDYETTYKDYEIKYVARNRDFEVPSIRMRRIQRSNYDKEGGTLQEIVVKATKVKMVYKGDTIVFNADAFNVPEGSMLDGLIKQLPYAGFRRPRPEEHWRHVCVACARGAHHRQSGVPPELAGLAYRERKQ